MVRVRITVTSDPKIAEHGCIWGLNQKAWEEVYKGAEGYITGPPVNPEPYWKCGTDLIWPVVVEGIPGWLCRHQFEAGD